MFETKDADFFELDEEDFDTILSDDISFRGTIKFTKPFMIRGCVTGTIDATGGRPRHYATAYASAD